MQPNQQTAKAPVLVLTGGGSGGHITPLLSLAHALKRQQNNCHIVYIGLKGEALDRLSDEYQVFDEVYYISAGKFRRYHGESLLSHIKDTETLLLNARDLFRVLVGIWQSLKLIKRIKPDVVFSKGGFVAVPVGIAAKIINVPIVTHDSDVVPGLANKIIGRWAIIHTTGMPVKYYKYQKKTVRYVGIPLSDKICRVEEEQQIEYKTQLNLPADKKIILISGGGLGATSLNEMVLGMAPELLSARDDVFIVHITGDKNLEAVNQKYAALNVGIDKVTRIGFTKDFYKYSAVADLVITRAGATTLAELAIQAKPCIVIPSPFLTGGHQLKNADNLRKLEAAIVLPNNATPNELKNKVMNLLDDDDQRLKLAENFAKTAKPSAADELAKILIDTASNRSSDGDG